MVKIVDKMRNGVIIVHFHTETYFRLTLTELFQYYFIKCFKLQKTPYA